MQQHGGHNRVVLRKRCEPELPVVSAAEASIALASVDVEESRQASLALPSALSA
jgi:hypothetical protein